jgi:soluble lytic murein transglycosylase-like protein
MLKRLVHTSAFVLLLGVNITAQIREPSIRKRSQIIEPYIVESARRYGIDPRILRVLCYLESRFRLDAISSKGARGPMQFMPETAAKYGLTNPHDPRAAIDAAARYLRDLLRRFDGRLDLAIAAYNAGEGTVDAFQKGRILRMENGRVVNEAKMITGGIPPYRETQNYVRSAIRLLTEDGLVTTKTSRASKTDKNLTWIRDFTIDVSNLNGSASRSREQVTPLFIDIP